MNRVEGERNGVRAGARYTRKRETNEEEKWLGEKEKEEKRHNAEYDDSP